VQHSEDWWPLRDKLWGQKPLFRWRFSRGALKTVLIRWARTELVPFTASPVRVKPLQFSRTAIPGRVGRVKSARAIFKSSAKLLKSRGHTVCRECPFPSRAARVQYVIMGCKFPREIGGQRVSRFCYVSVQCSYRLCSPVLTPMVVPPRSLLSYIMVGFLRRSHILLIIATRIKQLIMIFLIIYLVLVLVHRITINIILRSTAVMGVRMYCYLYINY
jgi:hypothetical protein